MVIVVRGCERCVSARTDTCPKSSSAARNCGPLGLDNVGHQRQLQILAAWLPLGWMSLRARPRTVARTAVPDMHVVITGAHVHVQGLKRLTSCLCMRSAIKHVHPWTGSLASPHDALSHRPHRALLRNPGVRAPSFEISSLRARECQQGGGRIDAVFIFGQRVQDLDRKFRISVPSGGRAQTVAYMAKWLLNRCCLCPNPVQI